MMLFKFSPEGDAGSAGAPPVSSAPAPTPAPAATPPVTPSAVPDWAQSFDDETRGYVLNKGFKDPSEVLSSYRNFEKLMGAPKDRLLKLPEKDTDTEGWKQVYARLGMPEKADGYGLKAPEGDSGEFLKSAQAWFHEAGLSKSQAGKLAAKWEEYGKGLMTQQQESQKSAFLQQEEGLKKEWGAAYDKNINTAKQAVREFGVDGETIDKLESVLGYSGVMKFMTNLGSKLGEDKFVHGSGPKGFGPMSPADAKARIALLKSDAEFVQRYIKGDASATEEMNRLHEWMSV